MKCWQFTGLLILLVAVFSAFMDVYDLIILSLHYFPGDYVAIVYSTWCWVYSMYILKWLEMMNIIEFADCFPDKEQRVIVTTFKGGSVFACGLNLEIATVCGVSVGSITKENDLWPPIAQIPPSYDVDVFLAMGNPIRYDENLRGNYRCVVLTRDPLERFVSLYKYARDGGEGGLIPHYKIMKKLSTVKERLKYNWLHFGRSTMILTHEALLKALNDKHCKQVRVDEFFQGGKYFESASRKFFKSLRVNKAAEDPLLKAFVKHDITRLNTTHIHASGHYINKGEEREVRELINNTPEIIDLLKQQQEELGY